MSKFSRRGFIGKITAVCGILISYGAAPFMANSPAKLNMRNKCKNCGSTKLWWADQSEASARGGLVTIKREDGAQVKFDMCADCYTVRVVDVKDDRSDA